MRSPATAPRAAIASRRARSASSARSPLQSATSPAPSALDDAVGIGVERCARIGQDDARLGRARAHAARAAPRRRRWRRALPSRCRRRAISRPARVSPSSTSTRPRAAAHTCPRYWRPRRVAVLIPSKARHLRRSRRPPGSAGREVRLAHQPVDVVDLACAQVVARVEADVERDARTSQGWSSQCAQRAGTKHAPPGSSCSGTLLGVRR